MILIHTALQSEAQYFIEKLKLKKCNLSPKIFCDEKIVLVVSGIGDENTFKSLEYCFKKYPIEKAINIGIAGSNDQNIKIGSLFCSNRKLENIDRLTLVTVDKPQTKNLQEESVLYDMEGDCFLQISSQKLKDEDIFIFKVVSDHLDDTILPKDKVKQLIKQNFESINRWI